MGYPTRRIRLHRSGGLKQWNFLDKLNPSFHERYMSMRPSQALSAHRADIRLIVERHCACNARVFGSVLTGEDTEDSDLDLLVDPTDRTTLFDLGAIRGEVSRLLGVKVDVQTPNSLPAKWRKEVLAEAMPI